MKISLRLVFGWLILTKQVLADVCYMSFLMADTNLDHELRANVEQLVRSPGIKDPTLTTWIYFDGNNKSLKPIKGLYDKDGNKVPRYKYRGTHYFTYNHAKHKLIIDQNLREQNSDKPGVLEAFLTHALQDCISKKSTEFVLILGSHGKAFKGFGGDRNEGRRRRLLQDNPSIQGAIQQALQRVEGAPAVLDVIAFDACQMSALDPLDWYSSVTNYYLASEVDEPAHGYAYEYLENTESALGLAQDLLANYIQQPRGRRHEPGKTLTLVNSKKYHSFRSAWEKLAVQFSQILAHGDTGFLKTLGRARSVTAREEFGDELVSVDIGFFLSELNKVCAPPAGSDLEIAIKQALARYKGMIVKIGHGPQTPILSGVQAFFPDKLTYTIRDYVEGSSPNLKKYESFLQQFVNAITSTTTTEDTPLEGSVCGAPLNTQHSHGKILYDPKSTMEPIDGEQYLVTTYSIAADVERVDSYFGLDVAPLLLKGTPERKMIMDVVKLEGESSSTTFTSYWDQIFYVMSDGEHHDIIFTVDDSYDVPVYIFDSNPSISFPIPEDDPELVRLLTSKEAVKGYLVSDEEGPTALFKQPSPDAYTDVEREGNAFIVPLNKVDGKDMVGGLSGTIFEYIQYDKPFILPKGLKDLSAFEIPNAYITTKAYDKVSSFPAAEVVVPVDTSGTNMSSDNDEAEGDQSDLDSDYEDEERDDEEEDGGI